MGRHPPYSGPPLQLGTEAPGSPEAPERRPPSEAPKGTLVAAAKTLEPPQGPTTLPRLECPPLEAPSLPIFRLTQLPSTLPGPFVTEVKTEPALPEPPSPGQRVGRYLVEEVLGKGGMGLVLRARDDILQRQVAVKVILPQYLAGDPTAGLRFLREAEIVAQLKHPHIIELLDAGFEDGIAYLVFDYIKGPSFADLRAACELGYGQAIELMMPVLSAISLAHRKGVVHGDLKPTNILCGLDYRGRVHPYILDFGVSFFSRTDEGFDSKKSRITGTPGYLAPEWLDGGHVDERADCFSLGCVLFELLTGRGPFADCHRLSDAARSAKEAKWQLPAELLAEAPGLQRLMERSLAADPEERYRSLDEFALELATFAPHPELYLREFQLTDSQGSDPVLSWLKSRIA